MGPYLFIEPPNFNFALILSLHGTRSAIQIRGAKGGQSTPGQQHHPGVDG
jgi:hypothetical protein